MLSVLSREAVVGGLRAKAGYCVWVNTVHIH